MTKVLKQDSFQALLKKLMFYEHKLYTQCFYLKANICLKIAFFYQNTKIIKNITYKF